jgi:hypothetical protein
MNEKPHQYCPICGAEVSSNPRYPKLVCLPCSKRAADENGAALDFLNQSLSGGFIARYAATGAVRDSHICYIDGIKCRADEARFGGIAIQTVDE